MRLERPHDRGRRVSVVSFENRRLDDPVAPTERARSVRRYDMGNVLTGFAGCREKGCNQNGARNAMLQRCVDDSFHGFRTCLPGGAR